MTPAEAVEQLYAADPRDFTRQREALSARLLAAGQPEAARAIKRLRKPSPPLWTVNRLARTDAQAVARLVQSVQQVRRTQLTDPRGAAEAMRREREHLDALVGRARSLLRDAGYAATPATLARVANTLLGAAASRPRAAELQHGRLTGELPAPGFEVLAGTATPRPHLRVVPPGSKPAVARSERREQQEQAARKADRGRRLEALQREAADRQAAVAPLERQVREQAQRLREDQARLADARRAARAAASAARRARRDG